MDTLKKVHSQRQNDDFFETPCTPNYWAIGAQLIQEFSTVYDDHLQHISSKSETVRFQSVLSRRDLTSSAISPKA